MYVLPVKDRRCSRWKHLSTNVMSAILSFRRSRKRSRWWRTKFSCSSLSVIIRYEVKVKYHSYTLDAINLGLWLYFLALNKPDLICQCHGRPAQLVSVTRSLSGCRSNNPRLPKSINWGHSFNCTFLNSQCPVPYHTTQTATPNSNISITLIWDILKEVRITLSYNVCSWR